MLEEGAEAQEDHEAADRDHEGPRANALTGPRAERRRRDAAQGIAGGEKPSPATESDDFDFWGSPSQNVEPSRVMFTAGYQPRRMVVERKRPASDPWIGINWVCRFNGDGAAARQANAAAALLRLGEAEPAWSAAEPEVVIGELDGPVGYSIANLIGNQVKGHTKVFAILNSDDCRRSFSRPFGYLGDRDADPFP